jgi:hypothetical protein
MKNPLSEIYSKQILLNEEKTAVVKGAKELDSKIGKAPLVKKQGPESSKKEVETPSEDKKYSDGAKAKDMTKESTNRYEGAFEKLFKATINEEETMSGESPEMDFGVEVPTETEDMVDELEDEGSDLVSDLRDVMDKLQTILGRLSEEENGEEENEEGSEEEVKESENEEGSEEEEPYEESVSMEDKGHALHGMKAGTQMMSKGNMKVASKLKTSTGSAYKGELKDSPEPKELGDKKGSLMGKKGMQANSTVKTGDFFK